MIDAVGGLGIVGIIVLILVVLAILYLEGADTTGLALERLAVSPLQREGTYGVSARRRTPASARRR